jgi:hypothetical protein
MPDVGQVDTSPYARIGQVNTNNLLGPLATIAHVQNLQNQNALFQQEFNARKALGPLAQESMGKDGQMDWNKFLTLTFIHPETAFIAPKIAAEVSQRKLTDAETLKQYIEIGKMQRGMAGSAALSLANSLPNDDKTVSPGALTGGFAELWAQTNPATGQPLVPREMLVGRLAQLNGKTNSQAKADLTQFAMGTASMESQLNRFEINPRGSFDENTGDYVSTITDRASGEVHELGRTPSGEMAPGRSVMPPQSAVPFTGASGAGATAGALAGPAGVGEQGAVPGAPAAAAQSEPAPSRVHFGAPGPKSEKEFQDMAEYRTQVNNNAENARTMLDTMAEAKNLLKHFTPGLGSLFRQKVARAMEQVPGMPQEYIDAVMKGDVSSTIAFNKLMVTAATQWMAVANKGNSKARAVMEWQTFQHAYPGLESDEGAILKMFDFMEYQSKLAKQEQHGYQDWTDRHQDARKWPDVWTKIQEKISAQHFNSEERKRSLPPTPSIAIERPFTPPPRPAGVDLGNIP